MDPGGRWAIHRGTAGKAELQAAANLTAALSILCAARRSSSGWTATTRLGMPLRETSSSFWLVATVQTLACSLLNR